MSTATAPAPVAPPAADRDVTDNPSIPPETMAAAMAAFAGVAARPAADASDSLGLFDTPAGSGGSAGTGNIVRYGPASVPLEKPAKSHKGGTNTLAGGATGKKRETGVLVTLHEDLYGEMAILGSMSTFAAKELLDLVASVDTMSIHGVTEKTREPWSIQGKVSANLRVDIATPQLYRLELTIDASADDETEDTEVDWDALGDDEDEDEEIGAVRAAAPPSAPRADAAPGSEISDEGLDARLKELYSTERPADAALSP